MKTIKFEHYDKLRFFKVEFISKSPTSNILQSILMEDFPIDTIELEDTHPELYRAIRKEMNHAAKVEWEEEIPTLAYQNRFRAKTSIGAH